MLQYLNLPPNAYESNTLSINDYIYVTNNEKSIKMHWPHLFEQQSLQTPIVQGHVPLTTVQRVPVSPLMLSTNTHRQIDNSF